MSASRSEELRSMGVSTEAERDAMLVLVFSGLSKLTGICVSVVLFR